MLRSTTLLRSASARLRGAASAPRLLPSLLQRGVPACPALLSARALSSTASLRELRREPHAVLGVARDATAAQIKFAYYQLAMKLHPDRSDSPDALERFNEIGVAYTALLGKDAPQARRESKRDQDEAATPQPHIKKPEQVNAFPDWVYRVTAYLERVPKRLDLWLPPTYASTIYQHLLDNELAEALEMLEESKATGEVPTHAVYEMLIRGCTIAMKRVGPGETADHLTQNLLGKVTELWTDMEAQGRKPDYLTYNELIRAYGKAGRVREAMVLFEAMCGNVKLLPEERALNSMCAALPSPRRASHAAAHPRPVSVLSAGTSCAC